MEGNIYSSWRKDYFSRSKSRTGCVFCHCLEQEDSCKNLIIHRGKGCFLILNLYPYTNGHVMVVPYFHTDQFHLLPPEVVVESMDLAQKAVKLLSSLYHPQGFNMGANLGVAGGAAIAEHVHFHIVPRWIGDGNFMSVIGHTRVQPETVKETYDKISAAWKEAYPDL